MLNGKPKIIDLFAGVGGLTLGAIWAGFDVVLAVEFDNHAINSHKINFPNCEHLNLDINELTGIQLLQKANLKEKELDGLVGGPPCQGFSIIGARDATDPRNTLFIKFFSLVNECKPKFFIVENVPGILQERYTQILQEAQNYVKDDYILIPPFKLKASDFGVPTSRERVFS